MPLIDCVDEALMPPGQIELEVETIVGGDVVLCPEEVEDVIAPYITLNHNEMIVGEEVELSAEELEEVIAPTAGGSSSIDVETQKLR